MGNMINIDGVDLILSNPDEVENMQWIGGETYMSQLLAAWLVVDPKKDIPMNPQILGKPGVGKTTLAYSAAKQLQLPVYIFQCTVDTRPEDLLISPVIGKNNTIQYHTSALVAAMINGGICILDEANRMSEKSWASLAPLLDQRRYIESIIAGIKIPAHPDFRICVTMNDDSSTFEVPEYIHSRLQPQIYIEFPDKNEEFQILQFNLPYARKDIIMYTVNFLQRAHNHNKEYTVRDGINICRYYLKMEKFSKIHHSNSDNKQELEKDLNHKEEINFHLFRQSIRQVIGDDAMNFFTSKPSSKESLKMNDQFKDMFDKLNDVFIDSRLEEEKNDEFLDETDEDDLLGEDLLDDLEEDEEDDLFYIEDEDEHPDHLPDFIEDDKTDDVIHIVDKQDPEEQGSKKKNERGEDIFFTNKEEQHNDEDPNDIIREFLERKEKHERIKKKKSNGKGSSENADNK